MKEIFLLTFVNLSNQLVSRLVTQKNSFVKTGVEINLFDEEIESRYVAE